MRFIFVQIRAAFILVLGFGATFAGADTVHFDDANRGPGDALWVGNIRSSTPEWLSPPQPPGQVATVSGVGMGSSAVGPISSVDVRMHYSTDALFPDQTAYEALILSVEGVFNSVTIVPHLEVFGSMGSISPFNGIFMQIASDPESHWISIDPFNLAPITITRSGYVGPSSGPLDFLTIQINMNESSGGGPGWFLPYRSENPYEETIEFGFSILSVDYSVPEPGVPVLLGLGLFVLWRAGRSRAARQ